VCNALIAACADVNKQNKVSPFVGRIHTVTITRGPDGVPLTVAVVRSND
jgi:hypothetical protein